MLAEMAPGAEVKPLLQLAIPLKSGKQIDLVLAEGVVAGEQAVIMDVSVLHETAIPPNSKDVMASFDAAHDAIHRVFVGVTQTVPYHGTDRGRGYRDLRKRSERKPIKARLTSISAEGSSDSAYIRLELG